MAIRRRIDSYQKNILPKRKRYSKEHRCIDCGKESETCRCDDCNTKRNAYMREWRIKNKESDFEYQKRWRNNNKERIRLSQKKSHAKQYGLTIEEYNALIKLKCGICGKQKSKHCMDHCHITNKVRGVLCTHCNSQLGWYEKYKKEIEAWVVDKKINT